MPIPVCWLGESTCFPNWEAWSAIGSISAASAAAFFGTRELYRRRREDRAAAREICSAAERASAYREVAERILTNEMHYHPQFSAIKMIRLNAKNVAAGLDLLLQRSNLTDGIISVGVAGREIAAGVAGALDYEIDKQNLNDLDRAITTLERLVGTARLLESRSVGVRREFNLKDSGGAARVRHEYGAMLDACDVALKTGGEPPEFAPF